MRRLGMLMIAAIGVVGCGSSGSTTTTTTPPPSVMTYSLPGGSNILIQAGGCIIVNAAPQSMPQATVSYTLTDGYSDDAFEVGVVPSTYDCQFDPNIAFVDDIFVGSANDSAAVPAGTYDLDVICQNATVDCLIADISWTTTY
jgi:hypothetical protein